MDFFLIITFLALSLRILHVKGARAEFTSYGSVIKLLNIDYKVRLHSHDVKYGTGSGQQSVTATPQQEDINSHWVIKGPTNKQYIRGDPVACGDVIRLQHLTTGRNLHSHHFSSPLSGNQEVSAYGTDDSLEENDQLLTEFAYFHTYIVTPKWNIGDLEDTVLMAKTNCDGDTGDHWTVICDGDYWKKHEKVALRHVDTDVYLGVSGQVFGRPINGQMEVVGTNRLSSAYWKASEGLFIHKNEFNPSEQFVESKSHAHTEL